MHNRASQCLVNLPRFTTVRSCPFARFGQFLLNVPAHASVAATNFSPALIHWHFRGTLLALQIDVQYVLTGFYIDTS